MTRAEMLARMTSRELSGWMALFKAQHDEQEAAEERRRLMAGSDGELIELNRPIDDDDDDEVDTDGAAE